MGIVRPLGYHFLRTVKSKALRRAAQLVPDQVWLLSLAEIERNCCRFTDVDRKLRYRFWSLLGEADIQKGIRSYELYENICSYTNYYNRFLTNPHKVAWMLMPESRTNIALLQQGALRRLDEIIQLDFYGKNGSVDHKIIAEVIRALEIVVIGNENL